MRSTPALSRRLERLQLDRVQVLGGTHAEDGKKAMLFDGAFGFVVAEVEGHEFLLISEPQPEMEGEIGEIDSVYRWVLGIGLALQNGWSGGNYRISDSHVRRCAQQSRRVPSLPSCLSRQSRTPL